MQLIWYFEKPLVAYCPKCATFEMSMTQGLQCSQCKSRNLSYFWWDEDSVHPEDQEDNNE